MCVHVTFEFDVAMITNRKFDVAAHFDVHTSSVASHAFDSIASLGAGRRYYHKVSKTSGHIIAGSAMVLSIPGCK